MLSYTIYHIISYYLLQSVYSWIISAIDPEILPPVFHLECFAPTNCQSKNCPHIYELAKDHKVSVDELPDVLYLREGVCIS